MDEHREDRQIEQMLQAYRPAGPDPNLLDSILDEAFAKPLPGRTRRVWGFRTAIAASVLLAIGVRAMPIIFLVLAVLGITAKGLSYGNYY